MTTLTTLRHLYDGLRLDGEQVADRPRDGRIPARPASVSPFIDGWYNPYVDTLARTYRR